VTPEIGMTPGTCVTRKEQANGARVRSRADIAKITGAPGVAANTPTAVLVATT
jgi:hypothetical protein